MFPNFGGAGPHPSPHGSNFENLIVEQKQPQAPGLHWEELVNILESIDFFQKPYKSKDPNVISNESPFIISIRNKGKGCILIIYLCNNNLKFTNTGYTQVTY